MDIVSFSKAAKVEREVKQARDTYSSLDGRLDAVSVGNVVSVHLKNELPAAGEAGRLYLVRQDSSNQGHPTAYTYSGKEYVRVGGDRVGANPDNGAININGTKTLVYTHPNTHSADILEDGTNKVAMTIAERAKLQSIESEANNYVHPETHSADMIVDGVVNVSMTIGERGKLTFLDSDLMECKDIVTYYAFDELGRVVRQVVTDNYVEQIVREPLLTMPDSFEGFVQGESFLVTSIGEVYLFDGNDFVSLPLMLDAVYQYDGNGRLEHKSVTTLGTTPSRTDYHYIYDTRGNRIAVKKY